MAPVQSQAEADIDLTWSLSQETPEPIYPVASIRPQQSITQLAPQMVRPKGSLSR